MVPTAGTWNRCGSGSVEREVLSICSEGMRDEVGFCQTDFVAAWTATAGADGSRAGGALVTGGGAVAVSDCLVVCSGDSDGMLGPARFSTGAVVLLGFTECVGLVDRAAGAGG